MIHASWLLQYPSVSGYQDTYVQLARWSVELGEATLKSGESGQNAAGVDPGNAKSQDGAPKIVFSWGISDLTMGTVDIAIVNGGISQLITGGRHPVYLLNIVDFIRLTFTRQPLFSWGFRCQVGWLVNWLRAGRRNLDGIFVRKTFTEKETSRYGKQKVMPGFFWL